MSPHPSHWVERVDKKWAAFALLVLVQTANGLVYKLSQRASQYTYSTYSALAIAELAKLAINVTLYVTSCIGRNARPNLPLRKDEHSLNWHQKVARNLRDDTLRVRWNDVVDIVALSAVYCVGNQVGFYIMLHADLASVVMFKSLTSFVVGLLRYCWLGDALSGSQWRAIVLQMCGLVVTQYNVCTSSTVLTPATYAMLAASILISALTSVWNERQLKRLPLPLPLQNVVLYSAGTAFNMAGHYATAPPNAHATDIFYGYNSAVGGVILSNACAGVAITAVYKYADAVVKSFATSVTTVVVMLLSWLFFNLRLNPVNTSGCIVVAISVYVYSVSASAKP